MAELAQVLAHTFSQNTKHQQYALKLLEQAIENNFSEYVRQLAEISEEENVSHAIIVSTAAATSVKLESDENQEFDLTRKWLEHHSGPRVQQGARNSTPSPRFWMKGALLEWCLDNLDRAKALLEEGLKLYPDFDKFYMMEQQNEVRARCVQAEPRHGDVWVTVSKDVRNWRMRTEELLELVANQLEIPK